MTVISQTKLPAVAQVESEKPPAAPSSNMPDETAALRRRLSAARQRETFFRALLERIVSKNTQLDLESERSRRVICACCARRGVPASSESLPTQKQIDYIALLARRTGLASDSIRCLVTGISSKSDASSLIDLLQGTAGQGTPPNSQQLEAS